jgi:hypothetical protein
MCSALRHYDQTKGKWIPDFHLMPICQFINQDDEIKSATSQNIEEYAAIDPTVLPKGEGHGNKF